jgi:beta-glucosidase
MIKLIALASSVAIFVCTSVEAAQPSEPANRPWLNPKLSPETRARDALSAMTLDEELRLVFGFSDQAVTEVSKVPDDIVSPELKNYVITHAVKGCIDRRPQ